ncbi:MAG: hypothetical protein MUF50_04090 [Planctomycetes bacterium]|jgi:hypothetical protein|nr:hypothetical protein [Planctomycetota bacterium]
MAVRIFVSGIMYVAFVDGDILDSSDDLKDIAQVIADNHPDQIEDIKFTSPPDGYTKLDKREIETLQAAIKNFLQPEMLNLDLDEDESKPTSRSMALMLSF